MSQIAVIGLGNMGQHHARICSELGALSSVCDIRTELADSFGQRLGVPVFYNVDDLLATAPSVVSIVVPTQFHFETAVKCLEAGCHVFLEKPISDNIETAEAIVKLANETGKVFTVGYIERFNPAFRALEALVKDGAFGEITSVSIKRVGGIPRSADNVVLDLMTHDLNLLMALFGGRAPLSIHAHKRYWDGILDSAQVLLNFGKASAICEANWVSPIKIRQIHATGTKGYCEVDLIHQRVTRFKSGLFDKAATGYQSFIEKAGLPFNSWSQDTSAFNREPLKEELAAFLEAVRTGRTDKIVTGEDALRTLEVTLEAVGEKNDY